MGEIPDTNNTTSKPLLLLVLEWSHVQPLLSLLLSTMLDCTFYMSCAFVLLGFDGGGVVFMFT